MNAERSLGRNNAERCYELIPYMGRGKVSGRVDAVHKLTILRMLRPYVGGGFKRSERVNSPSSTINRINR